MKSMNTKTFVAALLVLGLSACNQNKSSSPDPAPPPPPPPPAPVVPRTVPPPIKPPHEAVVYNQVEYVGDNENVLNAERAVAEQIGVVITVKPAVTKDGKIKYTAFLDDSKALRGHEHPSYTQTELADLKRYMMFMVKYVNKYSVPYKVREANGNVINHQVQFKKIEAMKAKALKMKAYLAKLNK